MKSVPGVVAGIILMLWGAMLFFGDYSCVIDSLNITVGSIKLGCQLIGNKIMGLLIVLLGIFGIYISFDEITN